MGDGWNKLWNFLGGGDGQHQVLVCEICLNATFAFAILCGAMFVPHIRGMDATITFPALRQSWMRLMISLNRDTSSATSDDYWET